MAKQNGLALLLAIGVAATAWPGIAAAATRQPNIILILVDDAGYADFPYFQDEAPRTPNIDSLCDEGLRFTQFYSNSPICSPSRAAWVTGQYPARSGISSFIAARRENSRRGIRDWLDPAAPSLPRMLQEAGYSTALFGKWHLGGGRDVGDAPLVTEYGFDESLTQFEGLGDRVLPLLDNYDGLGPKKYPLGVASAQLGRGEIEWVDRPQATDRFVDRTIKFIQEAEQASKPFYINLWPDDVHTPLFPPQALRGDGGKRELYLGVLENMDQALGRLFDFIRARDSLRDNTLIIVTSDNGHEPGAGSAGDLKGAKGTLYEGGVREPFIVWGPGIVPHAAAGTTNAATVLSTIDVVTALVKLAGAAPPAGIELDGENLSAALIGAEQQTRETPLYWNRPPDRGEIRGENLPDLAIRHGKWKLLVDEDGSHPQLYDIEADPYENANLARRRPQVARRLQSRVIDWQRSITGDKPVDASARYFTNPIFEGADPWVVQHDDRYLVCLSQGNHAISLHESPDLTQLGPKRVIWQAPAEGPASRQVWAPELHHLGNRWYVYFAASDGENHNHRTFVLESTGDDPFGPYELHGPVYTGDDPEGKKENRWSIDATVLQRGEDRYMIWSGWPGADDVQSLYIARMASPFVLAGPRIKLCENADHLWERVAEDASERGLNEGPQVLEHEGRTFVTYSASSSWQPTYKIGLLELRPGGDPLDPSAWTKDAQPAFTGTAQTFGVGHACFVKSPDRTEDWIVFHAKQDREDGWRRAVFTQRFTWNAAGRPEFGSPTTTGELLAVPSGTPEPTSGRQDYNFPTFKSLDDWQHYGHHQLCFLKDGTIHLGVEPREPVNLFRTGEKLVLRNGRWADVRVEATFKIVAGQRDAGILFRMTNPAVGYDSQEGYFAGIILGTQRVILGATDGYQWRHLGDAAASIVVDKEYRLGVIAEGSSLVVELNGEPVLESHDNAYSEGGVGLRVVDTGAVISSFRVEALSK